MALELGFPGTDSMMGPNWSPSSLFSAAVEPHVSPGRVPTAQAAQPPPPPSLFARRAPKPATGRSERGRLPSRNVLPLLAALADG